MGQVNQNQREVKMIALNARQTLQDMKRILDNEGIKFWAVDGTALGAMRDGDFIPWDKDMDIRVLAKDWDLKRMSELFKADGFFCKNSLDVKQYGDLSSGIVLIKRGIKIDMCIGYYYPPEDVIVVLATRPTVGVSVEPAHLFNKDEDYFANIGDIRIRLPNPPSEYLVMNYGKNWKVPNKDGRHPSTPMSLTKYVRYFHRYPKTNRREV